MSLCTIKCKYFPTQEKAVIEWQLDENGIKRRKNPYRFICGYDDHQIKSWNIECPYEKEKNKNNNVPVVTEKIEVAYPPKKKRKKKKGSNNE